MPALLGWLLGGLASIAGPIVTRVLLALGIGAVTYTGVSIGLDALIATAVASFTGLPAAVAALAAMLKLDVAVQLIIGAISARVALQVLNGVVTKFQMGSAGYNGAS